MWLSIATVFLWGAWGIQSKIIADRISPWMNQVLFPIGLLPLMAWMLAASRSRTERQVRKGAFYALITGVLGGTGNIAFLAALGSGGKASIVVPFVGLAPLVTVFMALVILKESLTRAQVVGLIFALLSIYLLST
jgi:transporter family protein